MNLSNKEYIKFKTPIAYAKPDKSNHIITKDTLKQLAKDVDFPLMVTDNFNYGSLPVGICTALKVEGDKLIADIKINPKFMKQKLEDSCFRISYTISPCKILDIGQIDKKLNDVYDKEDK